MKDLTRYELVFEKYRGNIQTTYHHLENIDYYGPYFTKKTHANIFNFCYYIISYTFCEILYAE